MNGGKRMSKIELFADMKDEKEGIDVSSTCEIKNHIEEIYLMAEMMAITIVLHTKNSHKIKFKNEQEYKDWYVAKKEQVTNNIIKRNIADVCRIVAKTAQTISDVNKNSYIEVATGINKDQLMTTDININIKNDQEGTGIMAELIASFLVLGEIREKGRVFDGTEEFLEFFNEERKKMMNLIVDFNNYGNSLLKIARLNKGIRRMLDEQDNDRDSEG
jgi:hypothetical protein